MAFNTNDLFDAVDTIVKSRIQKLEYDQTVEAKIVSNTQRADGIYKVEYQSAIFDAYANDSSTYYTNERVYVMVPKGDFTKQKYIVGRVAAKEDEEENSTNNFNFKLPLDNFVGLENLMTNNPMIPNSYLANKPEDGMKNDLADANFLGMLNITNIEQTMLITAAETKMNNLDVNLIHIKNMLKEHQIARAGSQLNAYNYTDGQTLLASMKAAIEALASHSDWQIQEDSLDEYWNWFIIEFKTILTIPYDDYETLWTSARAIHDKLYAQAQNEYNQAVEAARAAINSLFENGAYSNSNRNHLWSWVRTSQNPVIETKLGIGIEFKTLLGNYRPLSGDYGLRILISGRTKPTEEKNSEEITEEVYLKTSDMYGNVYAFYEPYVQQKVFDISHLLTLNRIDIFFWQDHNFVDYTSNYIRYTTPDGNGELPANIFVSGLDVKLGLTTDECQTDRVFLYTYDDVYYGHDALSDKESYRSFAEQKQQIELNPDLSDTEKALQIDELKARMEATETANWLKTSRTLNFAWVHLTDKGPVLVNHLDYWPADNKDDTAALQYWIDNGGAQIQWYHYEHNCPQDSTVLAERQGGMNWKYLSQYNEHVEITHDEYDSVGEFAGTVIDREYNLSKFSITVTPDVKKAKDRWKAVISVNDVPFTTEPLVFTNVDVSVETEAFDSLNEVVFRILHEEFNESANIYNVVENNQLRDFYVYDINGSAIKNENNRLYSDLDYYIQVWIRNNDTGEYLPMTYDPDEGLVDIEFNWPSGASMIRDWSEVSFSDLENAVLAPLLNGASDQYNQRILDITRKFHINNQWQAYKNNNTISATVKRKGKTYHPTIQFNFGQSSSMGTDYVLTLSQVQPAGSMIVKGYPFAIEANVRQKAAAKDPNSKYVFSWQLLSPTVITQSAEENWEEGQASHWNIDNSNGFIGNVLSGYVRNDCPPIFRVTVKNAAEYSLQQTTGFRLCENPDIANEYVVNSCAERVEFKADGTVPISYYGTFSVEQMNEDGSTKEIYPEWQMVQMRRDGSNWILLNPPHYFGLQETVSTTKRIPTNLNERFYAPGDASNPGLDGPFSKENPGQGYSSFAYGDLVSAINAAYDATITAAVQSDASNIAQIKADAELLKTTRLNNLDLVASKLLNGFTTYKFNPYVKDGINAPTWYWEDTLATQYYTYITFYIGNNPNENYFRQAVPFTRNLYSSTLLNSWDGKLSIDEDNNAILSQMISAGTKSQTDNTFTGVVMGNWAGTSDESLDLPGLYGLLDGGQVFGFRTDGTGFIGKSGRGRITFDGNQALISNIDRTSYINLDPIRYHYDGSTIVFDDYKSFSPFFLYSETKKTSTASIIGQDNLEESTVWAREYINDSTKDYFIVDPNNGILTSGGVIARYGKIGNWMISDSGLYQRYTSSTNSSINNRYMYLGYPGVDDSTILNIKNRYQVLLDSLNERKAIALADLRARYKLDEFKVVGEYAANIFAYDPMHYYNYGWPYGLAISALSETISNYHTDDEVTDLGQYSVQASRRTCFKNIFKALVEKERRCGWHWHYINGERDEAEGPQITGDRNVFQTIITPCVVTDPIAQDTETLYRWTTNNEYDNLGTNHTYRSVSYTLNFSPDQPTGEIIKGEQFRPSSLPDGYIETPFWYETIINDESAYIRLYETEDYRVIILGLSSGYSDWDAAENALRTYSDEVQESSQIVFTLNEHYKKLKYFIIQHGIAFIPAESYIIGEQIGPQDVVAYSYIPSVTKTYYTNKYPNETAYTWDTYIENYNFDRPNWAGLISDGYRVIMDEGTPDEQEIYVWTQANLKLVLQYMQAIYNFYTDAYNSQIEEALAEGKNSLTSAQLTEYKKRKARLAAELQEAINNLNKEYNELSSPITASMNKEIKEIYDEDKNRYAIYCGYDAPNIPNGLDPLFTVNWRGYMTARAGKIGLNQPWYITDYGLLTYNKNFGTIFMGNPEASANITDWTDLESDLTEFQNGLLPNHDEDTSPLVLGASDTEATRGKFAIYAGGKGKVWIYDATMNSGEGGYKRETESSATIKFGVRMDGTIYGVQGKIGGWYITNNMLYAGAPDGSGDFLVLDAQRGVINLNNAVVLQKDGTITLGKIVNGESAGTINIAGLIFKGRTTGEVNYSIPSYTLSTEDQTMIEKTEYKFWSVKKTLEKAVISTGKTTPTTMAKNLEFTSLLDITNGAETSTGITIGFGHEKGKTTKHAVAIYPSTLTTENSVLGTVEHPWDMVGDTIMCNTLDVTQGTLSAKSIFMGEKASDGTTDAWHLVATQFWVRQQLQDVYQKINDAAAGGSGGSNRAYGGCGSIASSLNAAMDKLINDMNNKEFAYDLEIEHGEVKFKTWKITGSWTDIVISEGESDTEGVASYSWSEDRNEEWWFDSHTLSTTHGGTNRIDQYLIQKIEAETADDGTVTIKLSSVKASEAAPSHEATFNQAGTAFFKARALKTLKAGNPLTELFSRSASQSTSSAINSAVTVQTTSKSTAVATKTVQVAITAYDFNDAALNSGTVKVDVTDVYTDGWNAGWKAAAALATHSKDGLTATITEPPSTPPAIDTAGTAITYTITATASTTEDTHKAVLTRDATMTITNGASFTDGGGTAHNPQGTAVWSKNAGAELQGDAGGASAGLGSWTKST